MSGMWQIGGFSELRELGSGAQGRVVLARHDESGRLVAIKYVFNADALDEARLLRAVDDPHVARLYDYVEQPGEGAALLMEAVDGVSLRVVLDERGALTPEASLVILKGSLLGLAAAHARGVVHRDYKPANVVVQRNGESKLIDFGVAVVDGVAGGSGTPAYMSPEQWLRQPATPSTDVYAATCVFFECVTGHRPYREDVSAGHLTGGVPTGEVPEPLRSLVARGMAKTASARPPGAAAFVTELEEIAGEAYGPDWERRGLVALSTVAMAMAALSPLALGSTGTTGVAQAAGQSAARSTIRTGIRASAKGAAAKAAVGAVALALAAGGAAVVYKTAIAGSSSHRAAAAPKTPPMIAYSTGTSVELRTGTGPARVLGALQPNQGGAVQPVWSPDGKRVAWLTGQAVDVADVRGGPVRSWACSYCSGIVFQGDRLLTSETGTAAADSPHLLAYPADGSAPVREPITGIAKSPFPGSNDFILLGSAASGAVIVAFGDAGGSNMGGNQLLYRVDTAGRATLLYGSPAALFTQTSRLAGRPGGATSDPTGGRMSLVVTSRGGACGYAEHAYLLNTASGALTDPAPPSGGGAGGLFVQDMWFDRTGAAYASFLPNPSTCATTGNPPAPIAHATTVVCRAEGGRWVQIGTGVIQAGYARDGWQAQLTGAASIDIVPVLTGTTLAVSHGKATATIPGVTGFAWAP
ncbi:MAG: hypothetical protein JWN00_5740 [Actinomycetia bacterium]|nr:hypothetical protein [Actinomycetes bacterium]